MFAIMFVVPKSLGDSVSAIQVVFFRYLTGFLTIAPFFLFRRTAIRQRDHVIQGIRFHLVRAIMGCLTTVSITFAITRIPLANAHAINMTSGMFAALFAVLFLRERLSPFAFLAILFSLTGAIVVAQPRFDSAGSWLSVGAMAALLSAMAWGLDSVVLKYTSSRDDPARQLCIVNAAAALILLGPAIWLWRDVGIIEYLMLAAMGPIAIIGQYFNLVGFRLADAINLAVVRYAGIVFAAIIGIVLFNEWPTAATVIGSLMIFAGAWGMLRYGSRR